jgi:hypothetical protein
MGGAEVVRYDVSDVRCRPAGADRYLRRRLLCPFNAVVHCMAWKRSILPWVGPGILAGITWGDWCRLLADNRFSISPRYIPRALSISGHAVPNSLFRRIENWRFARPVRDLEVPPPLFLLGHWRNGTTLLHNLIASDERFAFPNTFQALFPHSFLTTEPIGARLFRWLTPRQRPMDNVELSNDAPQEDEFALCVASMTSPLLSWIFQRRREHYGAYLTLRGVSETERTRWRESYMFFLKKLTWKYRRPLVLKSPPNTCRIKLLLDMFPRAKFVHIHRNPYAVFQSARKMFDVNISLSGLQPVGDPGFEQWILDQYRDMYDAFFAERPLIPPNQYCELAFEQLEADPLNQLRAIYAQLGLGDFAAAEPAIRRHLERIAGYQKNQFKPLPEDLRQRIAKDWGRSFQEWGYPV